MKNDLYDEINDRALETQKGALDAKEEGINDLYASIGLLSNYIGERSNNERVQAQISRAGRDGLLSLYGDARQQRAKILDNFMGNYRG